MPEAEKNPITLVADIGGTHARFASVPDAPGRDAPLQSVAVYLCADFGQLEDAIDHYLEVNDLRGFTLAGIGLALPGAVHQDPIELPNSPWVVSPRQISQHFNCRVEAINDFTAQALALPALAASDLQWLRPPAPGVTLQTRAIIGPGTGLGVAALLPSGEVVDSEGGHLSFAPTTAEQIKLLQILWQWFPRLSLERLLSGPGLANLYRAKQVLAGRDHSLSPEEITRQAFAGDPMCLETIKEFNRLFGSACGDLALALGAIGGVYLSGGVLDKLDSLFDASLFLAEFDRKGRYREYCQGIPVARVICEQPGLLGMARHMQLSQTVQMAQTFPTDTSHVDA